MNKHVKFWALALLVFGLGASAAVNTTASASSQYLTNVKQQSYFKTKQKVALWRANGKPVYVPKGTVVKIADDDTVTYKKGVPYANFDMTAMSYRINKKLITAKNARTIPVKLTKKAFKVSKAQSKYTTAPMWRGAPDKFGVGAVMLTADGYFQYINKQQVFPQLIKPTQSLKVQRIKVKGKNTYLYFSKPLKYLKTAKLSKQKYRLTIVNTKTTKKTKPDADGNYTKYGVYKLGGKQYFQMAGGNGD